MSTILDIPNTAWRDQLLPATYGGQQFHCEANARQNGQRVVTHQFPKRDLPYSELMGRRAIEFTVRGYCIAYPYNSTNAPLFQRDYRIPRDNLLNVLETGEPNILQLPTLAPMWVVCPQFRLTEEEKFGGYCVFDMTFVEYGIQSMPNNPDTRSTLLASTQSLRAQVLSVLGQATMTPTPTVQPAIPYTPPQINIPL